MARRGDRRGRIAAQLGWFALLWMAGVGAVGIVGYMIRLWLRP